MGSPKETYLTMLFLILCYNNNSNNSMLVCITVKYRMIIHIKLIKNLISGIICLNNLVPWWCYYRSIKIVFQPTGKTQINVTISCIKR